MGGSDPAVLGPGLSGLHREEVEGWAEEWAVCQKLLELEHAVDEEERVVGWV